jgi:hypothetical protein
MPKGEVMKSLIVALALFISTPVFAQVAGTIEGVQMPAWLQRGAGRLPILPGMEVRAGDQVATGAGARLLIKLAEGSVVKLGENAQMTFAEVAPTSDLFKAALNVLQGAFRFTTDVAQKARTRREVSIRAAQVTAGIRGTDLWGRSRAGNEIVCLIEGAIEVGAEGEAPVAMDHPLQFYRRLDSKTQPLGNVDPVQLEQWALETEMEMGKGALRAGGRFNVILASFPEQAGALGLYDQLRNAGYPAEIWPVKAADKITYHVRIRHLPTRGEAQGLATQLRGKFGITEPRISG